MVAWLASGGERRKRRSSMARVVRGRWVWVSGRGWRSVSGYSIVTGEHPIRRTNELVHGTDTAHKRRAGVGSAWSRAHGAGGVEWSGAGARRQGTEPLEEERARRCPTEVRRQQKTTVRGTQTREEDNGEDGEEEGRRRRQARLTMRVQGGGEWFKLLQCCPGGCGVGGGEGATVGG